MKTLIIAVFAVLASTSLFAQQNTTATPTQTVKLTPKNEIKINLAMTIAGIPELSYERFLTDNTGLGVAVGIGTGSPRDVKIRTTTMPYFRVYFGKQPITGLFLEANTNFTSQRDIYDNITWKDGQSIITTHDEKTFNFGTGAALGFKIKTRNGFGAEAHAGGGRLFGESAMGWYPRFGLSLSKSF